MLPEISDLIIDYDPETAALGPGLGAAEVMLWVLAVEPALGWWRGRQGA